MSDKAEISPIRYEALELERVRLSGDTGQFPHCGRYIWREWNARHADAERLEDFQITFMLETRLPACRATEGSPARASMLRRRSDDAHVDLPR